MSRLEVHQFLPDLGYRSAVGNHTLATQRGLREWEIRGGIWAEEIHSELVSRARNYLDYPARRSGSRRILLYQASTGSRGMVDYLLSLREVKAIYYHNITPAAYFEPYDPAAAMSMIRGREELKALAGQAELAFANSEYSAAELRDLGLEEVIVVPPYLPDVLVARPSGAQMAWLKETKRGRDLLFVGRVVPHKGVHDLLRVFACYRRSVDPQARLFVVGAWGPEAYMRALFRLRERLGLEEGVAFVGSVSDASLAAYYRAADVFVSLSEHEGFGLPLVEAMRMEVPVVAYGAAAVPETMGSAGVLVGTKEPAFVAEVLARVDGDLARDIIRGQKKRVAELESIDRGRVMASRFRERFG